MKKCIKPLVTVLLAVALLVPTVAMIMSNAVAGDPVELAFNNVFVFEKWATNSLSPLVISGGVPNTGGTMEIDIENGSFTLTKTDMTATECYTAFSMNAENAANNFTYYMMDVESNTSYTFTYNVSGNLWVFIPYVFMYTDEGLYDSLVNYTTPGYGINSFTFTTPSDVKYIQVRFTIGDTSTNHEGVDSVTANVSDIAIYKTELYDSYLSTKNLFSLEGWASNSLSSAPIDSSTGTITTNTNSKTITFTTAATANNYLWTGNSVLNSSTASTDYYSVDVKPSTSYTLTYSISDSTLTGPVYCQPYIVEFDANGNQTNLFNHETPQLVGNKKEFTTTATTESVQVVFAVINDAEAISRTCTVYDIGVYQTSDFSVDFETITGHPHRICYTEGAGTYGTLPTPTYVPDGYVFAGWYTGKDGSGDYISAETEISYTSYTVYPKYEIAVDSISIVNKPIKTEYTLGERFNPTGLVIEVTTGDNAIKLSSGYTCTPEILNEAGTQTITVAYGGKTETFTVEVAESNATTLPVNGAAVGATVANNVYTLNYASSYNRYEITYYSDSYVKGTLSTTATDGTIVTEEFFLEPSTNGDFVSYIDGFLESTIYTDIVSIGFECLDKKFGSFTLYSIETITSAVPTDNMQYQDDGMHKVGIDLSYGGALTYIEELSGDVVAVANGEGQAAEVNYKSQITTSGTQYTEDINLINRHDSGRFVQQSYYGTREDPYVTGDYNGVEWNYNPVQGGNYKFESSKIIDFRITTNEIYVKCRPLDWAKYSDEFGNSIEGDYTDNDGDGEYSDGDTMLDPIYGDDYITDSYMEAWYVFEDDMIKTYCRFVDFSGYPSATTTQEFPAFYCIEPFNNFAYYNGETVWEEKSLYDYTKATIIEDPDFWGASTAYNAMLKLNNLPTVDPVVDSAENWAAFMADNDPESFGIGIYSAGVTEFHYGTYPETYVKPTTDADGNLVGTPTATKQFGSADMYENGTLTMPDYQDATSYIAPVSTMTFESYSPYTYSYYIATGTFYDIREDFRRAVEQDEAAAAAGAHIAVPETAYMTPSEYGTTSTIGQYYVNNVINAYDGYVISTVAERNDDMSFGVHINGATTFTVDITNVTNPSDDIDLYDASGNEVANTYEFALGEHNGMATYDSKYTLRFNSTGLAPNEKATAKWTIVGYDADGNVVGTYTAYTVLYAPGLTIGAVAESRATSTYNNEISSWITGTNGVDHSRLAPFGSYYGDYHDSGRFIYDPLVYTTPQTPSGAGSQSEDDYIITTDISGDTDDYGDNAYVMQTATNGADHSRALSYLGLLTVDGSRYSNTEQIPNLQIGYDILRVNDDKNDSLVSYDTFYTLGTGDSYLPSSVSESPSGWTQLSSYSNIASDSTKTIPYRETVIPSYSVSDIDGKYIHALSHGRCYYTSYRYAAAGSSVLCSVTDKSGLRDAVLNGYTLAEEDYTAATYPQFIEALESAATVLGDPSADQITIDNAQKEIEDATDKMANPYYSLKYDNLFSVYEYSQMSGSMTMNVTANASITYNDRTLTVVSDNAEKTDVYAMEGNTDDHYNIDLKPSTEYVFEYDVETVAGSQVLLFFYDASGNGVVVTNRTIQANSETPVVSSDTDSNGNSLTHFASYQNVSGNYVLRFTTPANVDRAGFRFGNANNAVNKSVFSNVRLIEASKYYEDVEYSKTEDVYKEFASYGTLQTLTRTGYTFGGWVDASGNAVTESDIATENKSIYSVWTEHSYTIVYNANGGSGSISNQTVTYTQNVTLASSGFANSGKNLIGWSTDSSAASVQYQLGQTVSGLSSEANGTVTLYAVWAEAKINVTFDNLIDFNSWNKSSANNGTISNVTNTGLTITSNSNASEATSTSPIFPVTAGKQYMIDIDITGGSWDVYIFFYKEGVTSGTGTSFTDGGNRYSSNGSGNASQIFTAPAETVQAVIRLDANGSSNAVNYDNIRVYEYDGISPIEVTPANAYLYADSEFGTLPTPTKEGFTFVGWYDENGNQVTATSIVPNDADGLVSLTSQWKLAGSSLAADTAVVDFGAPILVTLNENDTIFNKVATAYSATAGILGLSSDGGDQYSDSVDGLYGTFKLEKDGTVTYTPNDVINSIDTAYYYAQLSSGDTTIVKNIVKVVPASNVLYEETMLTAKAPSTNAWIAVGTAEADNQDVSTQNDRYGYDASYDEISDYSNGSAYTVDVDSTNKRSDTLNTTFNGTGFDLVGSCGPTTGVQIVTVRNSNNQIARVFIIDTYYNDAAYGTLTQVPVACFTGDYDTYSVEITAAYLSSAKAVKASEVESYAIDGTGIEASSVVLTNDEIIAEMLAEIGMEELANEEIELIWMDDNSVFNGGTGAGSTDSEVTMYANGVTLNNCVDGFRVYNPLNNNHSEYNENEAGAVYYNVADNLADTEEDGAFTLTGGIFAYIEGSNANGLTFANYVNDGPQDEIYLSNHMVNDNLEGITFGVELSENAKVMLAVRAVSGSPMLQVNGTAFEIKSSTEMYYDITQYLDSDNDGNIDVDEDGVATIALKNYGDGLLAINNMKLVGATTASVSTYSLERSVALMSLEPEVVDYSIPVSQPETDESIPETDADSVDDEEKCWLESAIENIRSFFSDVFGNIKWIFELIISFFTTKEVY